MTIVEAQALIANLESKINSDCQVFVDISGLKIHSLPVSQREGKVNVDVKVQIPPVAAAMRKLGKKPVKLDPRTLQFAKYRTALPLTPPSLGWSSKMNPLSVMLNDTLGDCVIAGYGHAVQEWTTYAGTPFIPTDQQVLKAYEDVGGYVPGDPSTDQGCYMLDALKYWRHQGLAGYKIHAFVSVNPKDQQEVREAVYLFGNLYIGLALPVSAQAQPYTWHVPAYGPIGDGQPGTWGGHAVPIVGFSPQTLNCITWGYRHEMTWDFLQTYCEEAYVMLAPAWISANGFSPSHFNFAQLDADLSQL